MSLSSIWTPAPVLSLMVLPVKVLMMLESVTRVCQYRLLPFHYNYEHKLPDSCQQSTPSPSLPLMSLPVKVLMMLELMEARTLPSTVELLV